MSRYLFFFASFFLFSATAAIGEETQSIQARGMASILQKDKAIARDNALNDALRKSVEQAVGTIISSETVVENYQLISDSIFTQSQGYVKKYEIVNESVNGNIYQVTVSAQVAVGSIGNDLNALGLLIQQKNKPRVLFMISEQNIGQEYIIYWWRYFSSDVEFKAEQVDLSIAETALQEQFIAKGFNVVDISTAIGKIKTSNAYKIADLTINAARTLGKECGAEVVIKGKVLAKKGLKRAGSSIGTYMADMTASAIRVDNGMLLAASKGHGVARNISEVTGGTQAIEKASLDIAEKLIDQITKKWSSEISGGQLVQVTIQNISYFSDLVKFKENLKKLVRGVQSIYQRNFSDGIALLDVETKTNATQMADEISRKNFGIPIKVLKTSENTLELRFGS